MTAAAVLSVATPAFSAGSPSDLGLQDSVELTRRVEQVAVARKPWLVIYVLDRSGSMLGACEEDPRGTNRSNWQVVVEDAEGKLQQLQRTLGTFDLRLYAFGTKASEYDKPLDDRTFTVRDVSDIDALRGEIRGIRPKQGEETNLWSSIGNICRGLEASQPASTYAGVVMVVFSDGADAISDFSEREQQRKSRLREEAMRAALDTVRRSINVQLSVLPIGEWKRNPAQLAQLRSLAGIAELGRAIEIPTIVTCSVAPAAVRLAAMPRAGDESVLPVRLKGFDAASAGTISATLRDATPGLSLASARFSASGGELRFRAAQALDGGGSGTIEIAIRDPKGQGDSLSLKVLVPSFRVVAPVESWDLPPPCAALGNRRVVLLRAGESLDLAVPAPVGATVTWAIDGRRAGDGPSLSAKDLPVGEHGVSVAVATSDDRKEAELAVFVVDPTLQLEGATEARAGDLVNLKASDSLPAELRRGLGPATWTVKGADRSGSEGVSLRFDRRGAERVSVRRVLSICGTSVELSGSTVLKVTPGPAVRLLGGELVRGREQRIEAALSGAEEISRVVFEVDGASSEANIDPAKDGQPAIAWIRWAPRSVDPVRVQATPILKDDRGLDRPISDPECASRAQSRVYTVVEPEVSLQFESPRTGAELAFGAAFEVKVAVVGEDAGVVERVVATLRPERGSPSELVLASAGGWAASVTPTTAMGSTILLQAQAFEAGGPIGTPIAIEVALVAPEPMLVATGAAATGTVQWTGRNENPPPVTVSIVLRGTDRAYPRGELRSLDWAVRGNGLAIESRSESDATAAFSITRAGPETILARVVAADGRAYDLATEVTARPEQVVPAPRIVKRRVVATAPVEVDHAETKGAWTEYRLRGRTGDGEWIPLVEESFDASIREVTPAEVEVWYRPWGAEASQTPWDGPGGWVRSAPMPLDLLPPHSPVLIVVASTAALLLAWLAYLLLVGHCLWGAEARWTSQEVDHPTQFSKRYRLQGRHYRFFAKQAVIPIDWEGADDKHPQFGWVRRAKRRARGSLRAACVTIRGEGIAAYQYLASNGETAPVCQRVLNPKRQLSVSPAAEDRLEGTSINIPRDSRSIYLCVDWRHAHSWCHVVLPRIVLPIVILAIFGVLSWLIATRVI